ncbi:MAG: YdeI/OmpD-associated family protein [Nitrospinae bacterium]|nr:YdeI/OmpD-associated family protein [Nitrospinota bacterium]
MKLGKTLYITERKEWRKWLIRHHDTEKEIWLVYYKKDSGKPSLLYNDAVDEALCFGWIDSMIKKIDGESRAQRFTPRRPKSQFSEMNKERVRRLIKEGKMTPAGLIAAGDISIEKFDISSDILKALKSDKQIWQNFQSFPESYKRIRVGWIDRARKRPEEFDKRLNYFMRMTAKNKKYGMVQ